MAILVIGATGSVGKDVVAGLAAKGVAVRGMSRYPDKLKQLPNGVEGCVADMVAPGSLIGAFDGIDKLFLLTPLSQNEIQAGRNAVSAAKAAGVKKIVYLSTPHPEGSEKAPHFRNKTLIEKAIKQTGINYTILQSNNFFQNDYWGQAAIMAYNTYPQPIGNVGLNRIDSRDVADAAVNALLSDEFDNQEITLNGADVLTGESTAAVFAEILGKEVYYAGDDLEAWAKQSQHMMPAWMVNDLKAMYQFYQTHGLKASDAELEKGAAVIGHAPRSFRDFVGELSHQWAEN